MASVFYCPTILHMNAKIRAILRLKKCKRVSTQESLPIELPRRPLPASAFERRKAMVGRCE